MEDHQHAGHVAHGVREGVDLLACVHGEADRDQRLERTPEGGEVHLGVEALNHPAFAQGAQPCERRRGRDADAFGERLVGEAGVGGERLQHGAVDVVQLGR